MALADCQAHQKIVDENGTTPCRVHTLEAGSNYVRPVPAGRQTVPFFPAEKNGTETQSFEQRVAWILKVEAATHALLDRQIPLLMHLDIRVSIFMKGNNLYIIAGR